MEERKKLFDSVTIFFPTKNPNISWTEMEWERRGFLAVRQSDDCLRIVDQECSGLLRSAFDAHNTAKFEKKDGVKIKTNWESRGLDDIVALVERELQEFGIGGIEVKTGEHEDVLPTREIRVNGIPVLLIAKGCFSAYYTDERIYQIFKYFLRNMGLVEQEMQ